MIQYDWQTDTNEWEVPPPEPSSGGSPGRQDSWRLLLVTLFLLCAALLVAGRRVTLRVEQVEEATKQDVLAAHRLLMQAAAEKDEELCSTLITGRDTWWIEAQRDLVRQGSFTNREPLGLVQSGPAGEATLAYLSPELNQAEVTFPVDYVTERPDSFTETITLEHTMTFIREGNNWRYTRPDIDSWGEWQADEQDQIKVSYRESEGELGARLAADLIAHINDMCLFTRVCPPDTEIVIRLEETLNGLPQVSRSIHPREARISIGIPTPLLTGRPTDEAAYHALRRAYARHILSFLIVHWEAPEIQVSMQTFHDALLRRRFADLGLSGWPPRPQPDTDNPPYSLPDQHLSTICVTEPDQGSDLLVYDFHSRQWATALKTALLTKLDPLPDDSGVLLHGVDSASLNEQRLLLWRPGEPLVEMGPSIGVTFNRGGRGGTMSRRGASKPGSARGGFRCPKRAKFLKIMRMRATWRGLLGVVAGRPVSVVSRSGE